MVTFEISLQTSAADTHSGLTGGAARNPIGEIAQILNECYDASTGQVHIPGFYDDVIPATEAELDDFVASGFSVDGFMQDHGLRSMRSTDVRDVVSRIMAQPTFEVHGIVGGYTGPGIKAIVPPRATAKVSARLVSNQDPDVIFDLITTFIQSRHPDVMVTKEATLKPYLAELNGPYADAANIAMEFGFGTKPTFVREGGSIGAVVTMAQYLNVPIMMLGLSLPEQGYHAPNEFFDWGQASGGVKMYVKYFQEISMLHK